jgi:hypothetical protein
MPKYLFVAQSDCADASKNEEYQNWLKEIHIPDIFFNTPGIQNATLYVNTNPADNKRPEYMVVYQIETDDVSRFAGDLDKTVKRVDSAGRVSKLLVPEKAYPFALTFYKEVSSFKK